MRVEISQSKAEQRDYLKNVELARVLEKRAEKKREKGETLELRPNKRRAPADAPDTFKKRSRIEENDGKLETVLSSIF